MLIACESCHRQLDVGSHPVGSKIRCFCGHVNTVPEVKPRDVDAAHCSSCGAGLAPGDRVCGFCNTAVKLADKGIGSACPECFARLPTGAQYCSGCGVEIRPQGAVQVLNDQDCPRCKEPMSLCEHGDSRIVECTGCGGLWLDEPTFDALLNKQKVEAPQGSRRPAPVGRTETEVKYVPCPVCSELMSRRNFAGRSGVIIDHCRGHGYWFDPEELENILAYVRAGGLKERTPPPAADGEIRWTRETRRRTEARREPESLLERVADFLGDLLT